MHSLDPHTTAALKRLGLEVPPGARRMFIDGNALCLEVDGAKGPTRLTLLVSSSLIGSLRQVGLVPGSMPTATN